MGSMTPLGTSATLAPSPKKRWNFFWPEISDLASAALAARQGAYVALVIAIATGLFAALASVQYSPTPKEVLDSWAFVDAGIFFFIAVGIFVNSRVAAVFGLLLYIAERIFLMLSVGPKGLLVTVLFTLAFVSSIRGTVAVHRYREFDAERLAAILPRRPPSKVYGLVARVSFWATVAIALAAGAYVYYG